MLINTLNMKISLTPITVYLLMQYLVITNLMSSAHDNRKCITRL